MRQRHDAKTWSGLFLIVAGRTAGVYSLQDHIFVVLARPGIRSEAEGCEGVFSLCDSIFEAVLSGIRKE